MWTISTCFLFPLSIYDVYECNLHLYTNKIHIHVEPTNMLDLKAVMWLEGHLQVNGHRKLCMFVVGVCVNLVGGDHIARYILIITFDVVTNLTSDLLTTSCPC